MDTDKLVRMANDIGKFFAAQGDGAAAGVEDHLRRFWDPRMRAEITAFVRSGGQGLDPAVQAAVERL